MARGVVTGHFDSLSRITFNPQITQIFADFLSNNLCESAQSVEEKSSSPVSYPSCHSKFDSGNFGAICGRQPITALILHKR